jgi:signal transduction histidine kinase
MELFHEKYEVASLISDIAQLNLVYLGSKSINFMVEVDENIPAYLYGDELRIKQIFNNILSNAFKYTDTGNVTLSVGISEQEHKNSEYINLKIIIKDTGKGMTAEQKKALFDEYTRFHEKTSRFVSGTGLGMAITFNLLNMMNGEISVESKVDYGTEIFITLPQQIGSDIT